MTAVEMTSPPPLTEASDVSPRPAVRILLVLIGFYRTAISPMRPPACRYLPTCSEYAVDALRTWGLARGSWLAVRRLSRCHPWHAGGHDPVPSRPLDIPRTEGLSAPFSPAAG